MKTLAERIKFARNLKSWSQAQLASASGLSQSTVGNIEAGVRQSRGSLPELAKSLGISYEWLANGIGEISVTDSPKETASTYSVEALALAWLLDQIPDRLQKTIAANSASSAILEVLQSEAPIRKQEPHVNPTTQPS